MSLLISPNFASLYIWWHSICCNHKLSVWRPWDCPAYLLNVDLKIRLIQVAIDCISVDYCCELFYGADVYCCDSASLGQYLSAVFARVHSNNIIDIYQGRWQCPPICRPLKWSQFLYYMQQLSMRQRQHIRKSSPTSIEQSLLTKLIHYAAPVLVSGTQYQFWRYQNIYPFLPYTLANVIWLSCQCAWVRSSEKNGPAHGTI